MALSTRKKNIIIAEWKTGNYKQKDMLLKHKIDRKTFIKIVEGILPTNAHAVEVLHEAKMVENSLKNPHELKAVQNVVNNRLKVDNLSLKLLDLVEKKIENNFKYEKVNVGMGVQNLEATELEATDFKNLADTIDKASVTLGVNSRFSTAIQVNSDGGKDNNDITLEIE